MGFVLDPILDSQNHSAGGQSFRHLTYAVLGVVRFHAKQNQIVGSELSRIGRRRDCKSEVTLMALHFQAIALQSLKVGAACA